MSKLLSLALAALMAVFNDLELVLPKEELFFDDNYYQVVESESALDYRDLNTAVFQHGIFEEDSCNNIPYVASNVNVEFVGVKGYVWIEPKVGDVNKYVDSYKGLAYEECDFKAEDNKELIAPFDCILITSANSSEYRDNGMAMSLESTGEGEKYIVQFVNLKKWYCCKDREEPLDKFYVHRGSFPRAGQEIGKGQVIGFSTINTDFICYKKEENGKNVRISYDEMYYSITQ
ncbi:MAG: hypothetical protein LBS29_04880 [Endomicrobium sp.]|jgi:hypothetical protein|nr:hypothetical protein [Endomicrobium sp.]